jgi:hypothetical protein
MGEEIRFSPRELEKRFKDEEISERDKKMRENEKLYHRDDMRRRRENKPKIKKEINLAPKEPEVKSDRQGYMKDYFRKKCGFPEPKIKNPREYITDIKKYPSDFPIEEFSNTLDGILIERNLIKEKTLQDWIYDIMDKKGTLTAERMIALYNSPRWEKAIEDFMNERHYSKNGKEEYIPMQK